MKLGGEPAFFINKLSSSPLLNRTLYFYLQLNVADPMVLLQFISPFLFTLMLFNVCLLIIQKRKQLEVVVDFVVWVVIAFPVQFADGKKDVGK